MLILCDSHSRTWFVHYVPKNIRKMLYDLFSRQGGEYLNNYLNLKTVLYHKRIASKYFKVTENRCADRIKDMNFISYKGNLRLREMVHSMMNMRYIGKLFTGLFSYISAADLYLEK